MTAQNSIHTHAAHRTHEAHKRSISSYPPLPEDPNALARKPQCLAFLGLGNTQFYRLIRDGKLPQPVKIGASSFWRVGEFRLAVKQLTGDEK
jgi:predicted DNA-binding transcriptional regulator AlpA